MGLLCFVECSDESEEYDEYDEESSENDDYGSDESYYYSSDSYEEYPQSAVLNELKGEKENGEGEEENEEGEYVNGTNDLFALLIIMKRMLSYDEFKDMCLELEKRIDNLEYNLHSIKIDKILEKMGFPKNYMELANIERRDVDEFREN